MFEQEIDNALKVLRNGGTILYPTDTIWGIGCDATSEKAVEKVLEIKKRTAAIPTQKGEDGANRSLQGRGQAGNKSFIALVSDPGMLNRFVKEVPEMAWDLMDTSSPEKDDEPAKPLTIIYDAARGLAKNVLAKDGSIGIRLVKREANEFCHRLIHKFGKPIVSTSANISGSPSPKDFSEIAEDIISNVGLVVHLHTPYSILHIPSSIIKLKANGEFKIIRE
ncbi:MAG: Sua5/YciO/YrdC/YwlC family protein [Bacteroidetes bacterium]|nr:MAG: Sua5/YciO/YrdC/YwlC family protein [Bacteroidota bacterium]